MITFQVDAEITNDRRVEVKLPSEVPTGRANLTVTVQPNGTGDAKPARTSLADWAEENAEHWGDQLSSEEVERFTGRRF